ncbi:MAG TPA: cation transporter [Gryllotalpicola sp.]
MTATAGRVALTRRALRLAQLTVVYNVAEGIASVVLGVLAGLVSVIGFGFDSGIESLSAILVGLRLAARLRDREADEAAERRTLRLVALTFFALAAYVVVAGIHDLIVGDHPQTSPGSIVVLILSIVVMPLLAAAKTRVGRRLDDRLILADAAETRVCVLLSISTLLGLIVYALSGWTWVDPVAGFVIALFALHEGREAWRGQLVEENEGR